MKQYTRDQLGKNPFNVDNKPLPATTVFYNEVRCKQVLMGFFTLSSRAGVLLSYLSDKLDKDKDYLFFDKKDYMAIKGIKSRITAKAAVDELVAKAYITPANQRQWYWINPEKIIKL